MDKDLWLYAHYNTYSKENDYLVFTYERGDSSGDVLLEKRTISFDTPNDKELRVKLAAALKLRLAGMKADHYKEELEAQESINELLSLEFKPSQEEATI